MADLTLNESAELNLQMEAMTEETEGHCDVWNVRHKQLLENDKYLNEKINSINNSIGDLSFSITARNTLAVTYDDGTEE